MKKYIALLVLSVLSTSGAKASTSSLNMQLSPYGDGSSTLFSWNFTGDIVGETGHSVSFIDGASHPFNRISQFGITSTGIFSSSFRSFFSLLPGHTSINYSNLDPGNIYYTYTNFPVPFAQTNYDSLATNSFYVPFSSPANASKDSISLIPGTLLQPQNNIFYTNGVDSTIIPLSFSSFNKGTYSSSDNSGISGFTATLNVVPEPSTLACIAVASLVIAVSVISSKSRLIWGITPGDSHNRMDDPEPLLSRSCLPRCEREIRPEV